MSVAACVYMCLFMCMYAYRWVGWCMGAQVDVCACASICMYAYDLHVHLPVIWLFLLAASNLRDFFVRAKTMENIEEYKRLRRFASARDEDRELLHRHRALRIKVSSALLALTGITYWFCDQSWGCQYHWRRMRRTRRRRRRICLCKWEFMAGCLTC